MSRYRLSILAPVGKMFDGEVEFLSAPGLKGEFGVLGRHAPMVSSLKNGVLKIKQNGEEKKIAIDGGILEVNAQGNVLVLLNSAQGINETKTA